MNLLVISASQRHPSQSRKVADYLLKEAIQFEFAQTHLIDLGQTPLPLWDENVWKNTGGWPEILPPVKEKVNNADAYIIIVPEWNGAATPAVKNFLLFFGERETGHKPVLLVSVSNGPNGQYPVSDMRAFGGKNNKWIYIPDHLIIRHVNDVLNEPEASSQEDKILRERIRYSLRQLETYARHLKPLRETYVFDDRFKYAM